MASPLRLLKKGAEAAPLFITTGLGGELAELDSIVAHFGAARPVYGLQWQGLDGPEPPHESFEEMADCFAAAIIALQPQGPYLLAGLSAGGLVMLEVAIRLSQRNRTVALLALLDSYPHPRHWSAACWGHFMVGHVIRHVTEVAKMPWRDGVRQFIKLTGGFFDQFRDRSGANAHLRQLVIPQIPARLHRLRSCALKAYADYRPRKFSGTITFLRAGIATRFPRDPLKIWKGLAANIDIQTIPCDHAGVFTTHADQVAACLERHIENALPSPPALNVAPRSAT